MARVTDFGLFTQLGGIYELPSGKVELGESLDTALRREVKDGTGIATSPGSIEAPSPR